MSSRVKDMTVRLNGKEIGKITSSDVGVIGNKGHNSIPFKNNHEVSFELNDLKFDLDEFFVEYIHDSCIETVWKFEINEQTYRVKIGNIATEYMVCPEIVKEYCVNIIRKLYKEGYRFDDDKVIDFKEYLV